VSIGIAQLCSVVPVFETAYQIMIRAFSETRV
jgi:hypothetical protein